MTAVEIPEELYVEIQTIFRKTPVLLVGAGFSMGYELPSMSDLGKHLINAIASRHLSNEAKALWQSSLNAITINLEDGLNTIPNNAVGRDEIIQALREGTAELIIEKIKKAESDIIKNANTHVPAPSRLLKILFDGSAQNAECISVITTNYDTLIELFCDIASLPLDTGFSGFRRRKLKTAPFFHTYYTKVTGTAANGRYTQSIHPCKTVRIYKPHGSITWNVVGTTTVETTNEYAPASSAIIIPGPSKYEDTLVNNLFDTVRTEMNSTIGRASGMICIGFGFNDAHLQPVIKARLDAKMPMIIITRGMTEKTKTLLADYPHIIAVCKKDDGAVCYHEGKEFHSSKQLWTLELFLKTFVEG